MGCRATLGCDCLDGGGAGEQVGIRRGRDIISPRP